MIRLSPDDNKVRERTVIIPNTPESRGYVVIRLTPHGVDLPDPAIAEIRIEVEGPDPQ